MMLITVSGEKSGVGKTQLAEKLLKKLEGWSALKVTTIKNGACPRKSPCGVCDSQDEPFSIISIPRIINQKGKDTQRLKAAGAKKVLWLKAKPEGLRQGLKQALRQLKGAKGVVMEGTSPLQYIEPDLSLFVNKMGKVKLLSLKKHRLNPKT